MITAKLVFDRTEYERRIIKTRQAMSTSGLDLLITVDPSNMAWLTGYDGWSFYVHQAVILGLEGEPLWFGRSQDANGAVRRCTMSEASILSYPDHYVQSTERHPMDYLAGLLRDRGFGTARIGVEMDNYYYSARAHAALLQHLPDATFTDATALVNWQRAVKSGPELDLMRQAGQITNRIMNRIFERVEPGMRKCDLVADIYHAGLRYDTDWGFGGDYPAIVPLLPSGSDAAAPHLTWDDAPMQRDEGTFFEVSGCRHRYHAPLSRSVFLGQPTREYLNAEAAVLEGMEAGLEAARAGNHCEDIAIAFFDVLSRHGIEKDNRTGYPIGLSYPPDWGERTMSLRRGDRTVLEPGMTFHFMTGLWQKDWGFELTESIVITDGAPELLCDVPRKLFVRA